MPEDEGVSIGLLRKQLGFTQTEALNLYVTLNLELANRGENVRPKAMTDAPVASPDTRAPIWTVLNTDDLMDVICQHLTILEVELDADKGHFEMRRSPMVGVCKAGALAIWRVFRCWRVADMQGTSAEAVANLKATVTDLQGTAAEAAVVRSIRRYRPYHISKTEHEKIKLVKDACKRPAVRALWENRLMTEDTPYPQGTPTSFDDVVVAKSKHFTINFHSGSTMPVNGQSIAKLFPDVKSSTWLAGKRWLDGKDGWLNDELINAGLANLSTH